MKHSYNQNGKCVRCGLFRTKVFRKKVLAQTFYRYEYKVGGGQVPTFKAPQCEGVKNQLTLI